MLILPIHLTHNLLTHTVNAFDVTLGRDAAGRPTITQGPDYDITDANVQPANYRQIALLPEGAQSDGAQVFHTRAPVKAADNSNGSTNSVQTYIRHNGDLWKVWAIQNWKPHASIARYMLTRYVNVDGSIV